MTTDVIQADYEQLEAIANRFKARSEENVTTIANLQQRMDVLRQSSWEGRAAERFFAEMESEVLPASRRLVDALQEAYSMTLAVKKIIQEAEETAGSPFNEDGEAGAPNKDTPASPPASPEAPAAPDPGDSGKERPGGDSTPKESPGGSSEMRAKPWIPIDAPIQGKPDHRSADLYNDVINQFEVGQNSRYKVNQQGKGETYCNIFAWDVTRAMGAEIPHWVDGQGNPVGVGQGRELSANGSISWLETTGQKRGWRAISATEAQQLANQGHPVVATWHNTGGIGHMAVVRPGEYSADKFFQF